MSVINSLPRHSCQLRPVFCATEGDSPYLGASIRLLKAQRHVDAAWFGPYYQCVYAVLVSALVPCFGLRCVCTLLPLVSVVARDPRFEQNALRIVFGLYIYARFVILKRPCQRIASAKVVP